MLKPIRKFQPTFRLDHAAVSNDGGRFAACSASGKCWIFDSDLAPVDELDLGNGVTSIDLSEDGSVLIAAYHDCLTGYATTGNASPIFKLAACSTSFSCCTFRDCERVLCVASWDTMPKLTAWDVTSATIIDEKRLPSRGGEGYMLVSHPEGEAMALIAYSGQSEEWMFWAHYANRKLKVYPRPEMEGVAFPHFHPSGRELVSCHENLGLCRIEFPSGQVVGSIRQEEAFPERPDDMFSYDVHFFRDDRVLVWQECLALYEFELATLRPIKAILTGAEGRIFGEDGFFSGQSWKLAGNRLLTSDWSYDENFKDRTMTLRLWDASEYAGVLSKPDPKRPYTQRLLRRRDDEQ